MQTIKMLCLIVCCISCLACGTPETDGDRTRASSLTTTTGMNLVSSQCLTTTWKLGPMSCKNVCRSTNKNAPKQCAHSDCQVWGVRRFSTNGGLLSFFVTVSSSAHSATIVSPIAKGDWAIDASKKLAMRSTGKETKSVLSTASCTSNKLLLGGTTYKPDALLGAALNAGNGLLTGATFTL